MKIPKENNDSECQFLTNDDLFALFYSSLVINVQKQFSVNNSYDIQQVVFKNLFYYVRNIVQLEEIFQQCESCFPSTSFHRASITMESQVFVASRNFQTLELLRSLWNKKKRIYKAIIMFEKIFSTFCSKFVYCKNLKRRFIFRDHPRIN